MKNLRLIKLRQNKNLTQEQLAEIIGVSQSMIARIESGSREPRKSIRIKLASFFNVSITWLFYEELDDIKSLAN